MEITFFLKKLVGTMIAPLPICLLLFCIAIYFLYRKKDLVKGRFFVSVGMVALLTVSVPQFSFFLLRPIESLHSKYEYQLQTVDSIAVLGCWNSEDPSLPKTSNVATCSLRRIVEATHLSTVYPGARIYLSGHHLKYHEKSNPDYLKEIMISLGVESDRIVVVSGSKDTEREAVLLKPHLSHAKDILLVTSASHMQRAKKIFDSLGLVVVPVPIDHHAIQGKRMSYHQFVPSSGGLAMSEKALYEYLGNTWWHVRKFLGLVADSSSNSG